PPPVLQNRFESEIEAGHRVIIRTFAKFLTLWRFRAFLTLESWSNHRFSGDDSYSRNPSRRTGR
ncbi:MAG: hypothetical protein NWQ21_10145, partial [Desulfobacterales bacterium]|nr:hypothetical protein [Desulfobacterales bacterium]